MQYVTVAEVYKLAKECTLPLENGMLPDLARIRPESPFGLIGDGN
jgi:hypothetical protein